MGSNGKTLKGRREAYRIYLSDYVNPSFAPGLFQAWLTFFQRVSAICDSCPACRSGHDGVCFNGKISGYYTPGTFQQYALAPASYVTPIPEGLDSAAAAPMLCAGVTVYAALRKSTAKAGDWVVLLGAGGGLGMSIVSIFGRRHLANLITQAILQSRSLLGAWDCA